MNTTYSPVLHSDIDLVVAMRREFYAIDGHAIDSEKSRELFAQLIENTILGKIWLISSDGDVVGYAILTFMLSLEFGGTLAFVDELYLSDRARGKGIGKATMAFLKEEARRSDVKMLYLEVDHHNTIAQKLYLSAGFETHWRQLMQHKIK